MLCLYDTECGQRQVPGGARRKRCSWETVHVSTGTPFCIRQCFGKYCINNKLIIHHEYVCMDVCSYVLTYVCTYVRHAHTYATHTRTHAHTLFKFTTLVPFLRTIELLFVVIVVITYDCTQRSASSYVQLLTMSCVFSSIVVIQGVATRCYDGLCYVAISRSHQYTDWQRCVPRHWWIFLK